MKFISFLKKLFGDRSESAPFNDVQSELTLEGKTPTCPPSDSQGVTVDPQLAEMLENPPLLADPVFPQDNYLSVFGDGFFRNFLEYHNEGELIEEVRVIKDNHHMLMLLAGSLGFWAIDLEVSSEKGISGKDVFLSRVGEPIRRPPTEMAAFTAEQHIQEMGVAKIQVEDEPSVPEMYPICKLKTIGWYVATLVSPKR